MTIAGVWRQHHTAKVDSVVTTYWKQTKPNLGFKDWEQMRLNKHEMLLVLQTRTRCVDRRQPWAERDHLQARLIFLPRGENWSPTTAHSHLCVPVMKCPPEKSEMDTRRSPAREEGLRIQLRQKRAFLTNLKHDLSCKMAWTVWVSTFHSLGEVEGGRLEIQCHPQLQIKFEASLMVTSDTRDPI